MKNTLVLIAIFLYVIQLYAQDYEWVNGLGGSMSDQSESVTNDIYGNVYIAGWFFSDTLTVGSTQLINNGGIDIYIAKYNSNGNVLWAKAIGGSGTEYGRSVITDSSGNIYLTGSFNSSSITFGSITLTNQGLFDIYIVKFDPNGNTLWAKSAGNSNTEWSTYLAIDGSSNIYVTGNYRSSIITFGSTTLNNNGNQDMFIVKYDSSGTVLWARSEGGSINDVGNSVFLDASGNVYVVGDYSSSSLNIGTDTLINNGSSNSDIFIVKYDSNGNVLWASGAGGNDFDSAFGVTTDAAGNVYQTGLFINNITFGSFTLTSNAFQDMFIVKYDSSGNALWAISTGGSFTDTGNDLITDASGNIYVTGRFEMSTDSGAISAYIAKYDPNGNVLWAKEAYVTGNNLSLDASGNIYVIGEFTDSIINFGNTTLINKGTGSDVFIVKIKGSPVLIKPFPILFDNVKLYPNPNKGQFIVELTNTKKEDYLIEVRNIIGQLVYTEQIDDVLENFTKEIDLSGDNGVYFLSISSSSGTRTEKLIVY